MANIYVTRRIPEAGLKLLEEKFGKFEMNKEDRILSKEELMEKVKGRDAVLSLLTDNVDEDVIIAAGPQCKIFANYAVGFNNINIEAATKHGVMVSNTPGVLTDTTADFAISLMFAVARRLVEGDKYMRSGKYQFWGPMLMLGKEITNKTIGIVGAGRIGSNIAYKLHKGFNMKVIYHDRNIKPEIEKDLNAIRVDLDTLCKEADYIFINMNYVPETHHLINENNIKLMRPDTVIINTARGPIIEEKALVKALQEKRIFGAGLDVFEKEPEMEPGLVDLDNVVIEPHIGSATIDTRNNMAIIAAKNIIQALSGETPECLVNPEVLNK